MAIVALTMTASAAQKAATYPQKERAFHSAADFARVTGGKLRVERTADEARLTALRRAIPSWPVADVTVLGPDSGSALWVGTRRGAIRLQRRLPPPRILRRPPLAARRSGHRHRGRRRYRVARNAERLFAHRLSDDDAGGEVAGIRAAHPGAAPAMGPHRRLHLACRRRSLDQSTRSTDNDGLWTAMYVAAESFRFKVTGDAAARDNARQGMQAILRLEQITGRPGFPARSFIKVGEDEQPKDGEWHDTPDKAWRWKGDTSSDEIVGHYFVYPIYYDLVADDSREAGAAGGARPHHQPHPRQQLPVDRRRRPADALGLVDAGTDLGRRRRDRPARAPPAVAPPRRACT